MSRRITRRTIALLAGVCLLLTLAFATAPQANADTLFACVKKEGGAMRLVGARTKCRRRIERKVSWNITGPAGKNGATGKSGVNGANGANGTNGSNLTTQTPLASGQSESGWFAVGDGDSTKGFVGDGITFSQPLSAPIVENHVIFNPIGSTSSTCPGVGQAARGFVCLYLAEDEGMTFNGAFPFNTKITNAADRFGFALYFNAVLAEGFADGSWTVTAP
ncbi:MAG: hypothetical protein ACYDHT_04345 [Solirubrobacteraceae bacterium]